MTFDEKCHSYRPGANVIKNFTNVIYYHYMMLVTFCVLKNITTVIAIEWQLITTVKSFVTLPNTGKHKCPGNLTQYLNPSKSRVKVTMVICIIIILLHWFQGSLL
jgi:hypothetical protein